MRQQRLMVRVGRAPAKAAPTMLDHIDAAIDQLVEARRLAAVDRRSHALTEQLLDEVYEAGEAAGPAAELATGSKATPLSTSAALMTRRAE